MKNPKDKGEQALKHRGCREVREPRIPRRGRTGEGRGDGSREHELQTLHEVLRDLSPEGQRMRAGCGIRAAGSSDTCFVQRGFCTQGDSRIRMYAQP